MNQENSFSSKNQTLLLLTASLLFCVPYFFKVYADPDIWWQLKSGLHNLGAKSIQMTDVYSYTAYGQPWINHEWLSGIILAYFYRLSPEHGLFFFRAVVLWLSIFTLMKLYKIRWKATFFTLIVTSMIMPQLSLFISLRPHTFSYFLILVYMLMMESYRKNPSPIIWFIPILSLLWTNLHGGFILGLLYLAACSLEFRARKDYMIMLLLSFLAPLLNPYGLELFTYLFKEITSDHSLISEWQPIGKEHLPYYLGYGIVPLLAALTTKSYRRMGEFYLFIFTLLGVYLHRRFFPLMMIFGTLFFVESLPRILNPTGGDQSISRLGKLVLSALTSILLVMASYQAVKTSGKEIREGGFWVRSRIPYPEKAVAFLRQNQLHPNVLVAFQWGGYVIWNLFPEYKVSVDGRNLTLYPRDYVSHYLKNYRDGHLKELLGKFKAETLLIENQGLLYQTVANDLDWKEVYRDEFSSVFKLISHSSS